MRACSEPREKAQRTLPTLRNTLSSELRTSGSPLSNLGALRLNGLLVSGGDLGRRLTGSDIISGDLSISSPIQLIGLSQKNALPLGLLPRAGRAGKGR